MRCAQQCGTRRFQSTTPLGRRHFFGNIVVFDIPISIHDSARKATTDLRASCNDIRISIHASAREATSINHVSAASTAISIHASAREATANLILNRPLTVISIHASAREATISLSFYSNKSLFQSTPPRGRRLYNFRGGKK